MWRCQVCGYLHEGSEPPDRCPKCGVGPDKFAKLSEEEVQLIQRSRHTNSMYMELHQLLRRVEEVADRGIADQLDPPCTGVFTRARQDAMVLQQMIRTEIRSHVGKGKWG